MQPQPSVDKPSAQPPAKLDPATLLNMQVNHLRIIEGHLKSIRSMLNFFTILAVLALVGQACSVILSLSATP